MPIIWDRKLWSRFRVAAIAITLSGLVQIAFVNGLYRGLFLLDYSLRFAAAGIPCSVLGLSFALRGAAGWTSRLVIVGCSLNLLMWLFFITLH